MNMFMASFPKIRALAVLLGLAGLTVFPAMAGAQDRIVRTKIVPDARTVGRSQWSYTTQTPGSEWTKAGFDASGWSNGPGGFGTDTGTIAGIVLASRMATVWSTENIWLRKTFDYGVAAPESLILCLHHDENVEVYLNGIEIYTDTGWISEYKEINLGDSAKAALKPEGNVLAIHCRNTDGPGYIDAGLVRTETIKAAVVVSDARTSPQDWKYVKEDPGADWFQPAFGDGGWPTGKGGFGSADQYSATLGTEWLSPDIWMRRTFTAGDIFSRYVMSYLNDEIMEVYLNGTLVAQDSTWTNNYRESVFPSISGAIKVGENVLAVHCSNSQGPQFVDLGLFALGDPIVPVGITGPRALSGRAGGILYAAQGRVDLSRLHGTLDAAGGRLRIFGMDGGMRASLHAGAGQKSLPLSATLGTGMFRYRWDSPSGSRSGALVRLP